MSSSRRISRSRRTFLKTIPAAVAASVAAPPAAGQQTAVPTPSLDVISADTLDAAQQIIGVTLPDSERESARPLVVRNLDNYATIRRVTIPSETEPAFSFHPPLPRSAKQGARASVPNGAATQAPATPAVGNRARSSPRFNGIEDLAFAPVTTLAHLLASKR
jgi:hypothetical protein